MTTENNSQSDEVKGPDPNSIYGEEVPSYEEVEEEISQPEPVSGEEIPSYEEMEGEILSTTPPPPETPEPQEPSPEEIEEAEETPPPSEPLRSALQGKNIADIAQQLTEEEKDLLQLRFDLTTGRRVISQEEAAEQLGLGVEEFRRRERELFGQINYLATLDAPDTED